MKAKSKPTNGTPYTDEQWRAWYSRKSSSELAQEEQERLDDIQESTDSLEEKLQEIDNPYD